MTRTANDKSLVYAILGAGTIMGLLVGGSIVGVSVSKSWRDTERPQPPETLTLYNAFPDDLARKTVGIFYQDLATAVEVAPPKTLGAFREAQIVAVNVLKKSARLPDAPEANQEISKRIEAAVGLEDAALDEAKRTALVGALRGVSEELLR